LAIPTIRRSPKWIATLDAIRSAKRKQRIAAIQRKKGVGRKRPETNDGDWKGETNDGSRKGEKKRGANISAIEHEADNPVQQ
jgi:hypothetical protein